MLEDPDVLNSYFEEKKKLISTAGKNTTKKNSLQLVQLKYSQNTDIKPECIL